MPVLKSSTGFLSVSTSADGVRRWRVIYQGQTLSADTPELSRALTVARQTFGRQTIAVWDEDRGEFGEDMDIGPTI